MCDRMGMALDYIVPCCLWRWLKTLFMRSCLNSYRYTEVVEDFDWSVTYKEGRPMNTERNLSMLELSSYKGRLDFYILLFWRNRFFKRAKFSYVPSVIYKSIAVYPG